MDWKTHFVIVRPKRDGTVVVVNEGNSLKDSRYWLNYIAESLKRHKEYYFLYT